MKFYLDSSVILRKLLNQSGISPYLLKNSGKEISPVYSSRLLQVECNRVLDRFRLENILSDRDLSLVKKELNEFLKQINFIELTRPILEMSSQSFPTQIGTLDSIHLSTLLLANKSLSLNLSLLTHDQQLINAAIAMGVDVL